MPDGQLHYNNMDTCSDALLRGRKKRMYIINQHLGGIDNSFKFTINTSLGTGNTFTLPLRSGYTYNLYWKPYPGATPIHVTAYNDANRIYDYGTPFNGQIEVYGTCGAWYFNNTGDKAKLVSIDNWGNINLIDGNFAFFGCSNCVSIPDGPITWPTMTNGQGFFRAFGISTGQSIPNGLLDQLTEITTLSQFFYLANFTGSIPANLFKYTTKNTTCDNLFRESDISGSLPNDIFRYMPLVTSFVYAFYATGIDGQLPENLFYYNGLVTNYSRTFQSRPNLVLPSVMFDLTKLNIVTTFDYFADQINGVYSWTGTIQDVWNYAISSTSVNTFRNQISMSNYASIPDGWKGL